MKAMSYILLLALTGLTEQGNAQTNQPPTTKQPAFSDPFAYCRAVRNMEWQEGNAYPGYIGPSSPKAVTQALKDETVAWRCADGEVYGCQVGASGRGCMQKDISKTPSPAMQAFCRKQPNADFIDMATSGNSNSSWKCAGGRPVITETRPVDQRGYYRSSWRKISP